MKNIMVNMDEELIEALKDTGNVSHTIREAVRKHLSDKPEENLELRKKDRQDNIRRNYKFVSLDDMKYDLTQMQHPLTIECMKEYIAEREANGDILCERRHDI